MTPDPRPPSRVLGALLALFLVLLLLGAASLIAAVVFLSISVIIDVGAGR